MLAVHLGVIAFEFLSAGWLGSRGNLSLRNIVHPGFRTIRKLHRQGQ